MQQKKHKIIQREKIERKSQSQKFSKNRKNSVSVASFNFICLLVIYYSTFYTLNMKCMSCVKCNKQQQKQQQHFSVNNISGSCHCIQIIDRSTGRPRHGTHRHANNSNNNTSINLQIHTCTHKTHNNNKYDSSGALCNPFVSS